MIISHKVRFLNLFRNVLKLPFIEERLAALTSGRSTDHFFCKLVPNSYQYPPGSMRLIHRHGLTLRADISDYIGHFLYFGFREKSIDKLFSLCRPGSHVIDVGTNIGWTLLNFAKISQTGKVLGFEPDPDNFAACHGNIELNKLDNVTILQKALGTQKSTAMMEVRTPSNRGGNRIAPGTGKGSVKVIIERLDDVTDIKAWHGLDLIKIDVEGYELHVLEGATSLLSRYKPTLFIEVDDDNLNDQGNSAKALIAFLELKGYHRIYNAETDEPISIDHDFGHCHFDIIAE